MFEFPPFAFREPSPDERQPITAGASGAPSALNLVLGALTLPLLGGIVSSRWLGTALSRLGSASEELFRGDRLPLLKDLPKDLSQTPDES